jgi:hypothetical protein
VIGVHRVFRDPAVLRAARAADEDPPDEGEEEQLVECIARAFVALARRA